MLNLLLTFFIILGLHEYYVSVTECFYNQEKKRIEVAVKVFADDLEKALTEGSSEKLYLGEVDEVAEADELITTYIDRHFTLEVNGKRKELNFIGKEMEDEAMWCYFTYEKIRRVKTVSISSELLLDHFPSQSNIIHFKSNGKEKSLLLDGGTTSGVLTFK